MQYMICHTLSLAVYLLQNFTVRKPVKCNNCFFVYTLPEFPADNNFLHKEKDVNFFFF